MDHFAKIREDMRVIDSTGADVGKVRTFKAGDPGAITAEGQERTDNDPGLVDLIRSTFNPETLPEQQREQLLRTGYVEVDGKGIGNHFFVTADQVESVDDDTVRLTVEAP